MSVGTGVGGSDVIQGRIPLAQLGNPNQVQIIATSSVGGTVSIAGNTWAGVNISTPISPNVPGVTPQPIPATGTLTLGLLLLAVFALSFVAYRRRYGRYHWVLLLCLPAVFTVAWALTWTTVTSTKSGNIHQLNVATDNNNLHIQLHVDIGGNQSSNDDSSNDNVLEGVFLYEVSPKLNEMAKINFSTSTDKINWSVVEQPTGANLPLNVSADSKTVEFKVTMAGVYTLQTEDNNGKKLKSTIRVGNNFPIDESKIVKTDENDSLDEAIGEVSNQYWVRAWQPDATDIKSIVAKFSNIDFVGEENDYGTLIQIDENNLQALHEIEKLRLEQGIKEVEKRIYIGDNAIQPSLAVNDYSGLKGDSLAPHKAGWHLGAINMPEAWDYTTGSSDIYVGVCDGGFFKNAHSHEDMHYKSNGQTISRFADVVTDGVWESRELCGKTYTAKEREDSGKNHGMMVSGIIGAVINNKKGIAGINNKSRIIGSTTRSPAIDNCLLNMTTIDNVKVINHSMGFYIDNDINLNSKVEVDRQINKSILYAKYNAIATQAAPDKLFVQSAGNGVGNGCSSENKKVYGVDGILEEAINTLDLEYDNTIVVAAMVQASETNENRLIHYSAYNKDTDSVDIAAPTSFKSIATPESLYYVDNNNRYGYNDSSGAGGTSSSAPVVAGVASLIYSINPNFTGAEVKKILIDSAIKANKYVKVRYTGKGENSSTEPLKDKGIPILDAAAALKMAKEWTNNKKVRFNYWMPDVTKPRVAFKFAPYNSSSNIDSVAYQFEGKSLTSTVPSYEVPVSNTNQSSHNLSAKVKLGATEAKVNEDIKVRKVKIHVDILKFNLSNLPNIWEKSPLEDVDLQIAYYDNQTSEQVIYSNAKTDSNGDATVYLTPGVYVVRPSKEGVLSGLSSTGVVIVEPQNNTNQKEIFNIEMVSGEPTTGGVSGTIKDLFGYPAIGVKISIKNLNTGEVVGSRYTNRYGEYLFNFMDYENDIPYSGFRDADTGDKKTLPVHDSNNNLIQYELLADKQTIFTGGKELTLVAGKYVHRNGQLGYRVRYVESPISFNAKVVDGNSAELSWQLLNIIDPNKSAINGFRIRIRKEGEATATVLNIEGGYHRQTRIDDLEYGARYFFSITSVAGTEESEHSITNLNIPDIIVSAATKLNDTGITKCGTADSTSNTADCSTAVANASGSQVPQGQDGHYGTGINGSKGMVFEKVSGYEDKCVLDKHTGLMWEVKQTSGLHSKDNTYTWYSTSNNNGNAGTQNGGTCSGSNCDTAAFVNAVNAAGWCGHNDWRLPTRKELRSIVDYSRYNPAIDTTYFPNTKYSSSDSYGFYWSSSPYANSYYYAWGVYFYGGYDGKHYKPFSRYVRLVRGGL